MATSIWDEFYQAMNAFFGNLTAHVTYGGTGQTAEITGSPTGAHFPVSTFVPGYRNGVWIDMEIVAYERPTTPLEIANGWVQPMSRLTLELGEGRISVGMPPFDPSSVSMVVGAELVLHLSAGSQVKVPMVVGAEMELTLSPLTDSCGNPGQDDFTYKAVVGPDGKVHNVANDLCFDLSRDPEIVVGTAGNDLVTGGNILVAGAGNDTLVGTAGVDLLVSGSGNNELEGGDGGDILDGSHGWAIAMYLHAHTAVTVHLDGSGNSGDQAAGDIFRNVDGVSGSNFNDTLVGNANGNWMIGRLGNDSIDGGDGNDTLFGSEGDDTLVGGTGDDHLLAGLGNNMLEGGGGADTLDGSDGWGVADYHRAIASVKINLDGSGNSGDEAFGDTFINVNGVSGSHFADTLNGNGNDNVMTGDTGNDTIAGGGGNDTLYGSDGDDQLVGGAGNDRLAGGGGNNVLEGGAGADTLDGSYGWGVADYRNAHGAVTIHLDGSGNAGDEAAGDVYINIDGAFGSAYGDTLVGNDGDNWMLGCGGNDWVGGGRGSDTLYGSEGNDTLVGGAGNDTLYGESGQDVFRFDAALNAGSNVDRIVDFNVSEDRIQLERGIFTALATGPLASSAFAIGNATNTAQHILYNASTGDLSYDADGSGAQAAVIFARASTPGASPNAGAFFVV